MKRFLILIALITCISAPFFAENDASDDDITQTFVYEMNGRGDQYIKIGIFANFPLNFGNPFSGGQLYTGGAAELGYHRFISGSLALGMDLMVGYNPTIGSNSLTMVPVTFGITWQPSLGKFEFPLQLGAGFAFETCQNKKYFPSPALKAELGSFFRMNESWSFGLTGNLLYLPQWAEVNDKIEYDAGLFAQVSASVRYHF